MIHEFRGKKILVTGATGFLGGSLAGRLLKEGCAVRALTRNPAKGETLQSLGAEMAPGDLTDENSLKKAVRGCRVIFHFAGVMGREAKPLSYFKKINVEGTRLLAEAALQEGVERFIHAGSAWGYGFDAPPDTDEDSTHFPSNDPYCDTKWESQQVVLKLHREQNLPVVIVQPTVAYGPGDRTWTLEPIKLIRSKKMVLPNGGRGLIQPIYIGDTVEGIIAAARKGRLGESYILGGTEVLTVREFFDFHLKMLGGKKIPSVPGWLALGAASLFEFSSKIFQHPVPFTKCAVRSTMKPTTFKGDKARRELGFVPQTDLAAGMSAAEEWLRQSGYL